jgi:uncharacterized membrane protein
MTSTDEVVTDTERSSLPTLVLGLSVLGVLVSAYLTFEHFNSSPSFACPETSAINCVKVTTSSYAEILGVPVAILGLGYFVAMTAMSLPGVRDHRVLARIRLAASALGVAFVCYLVWVELFRVDAICLWCTAVHVIAVLVFGLLATHEALRVPED